MANYENLKSAIQQVVKTNGNNAITGALLQQSLLAIINSLGAGYQFIGVATPTTNPGTPDKRVFYIASTAGTYSNFDGLEVTEDEVVVLTWDSSWRKTQIGTTKVVQGEPGPEGPQGIQGEQGPKGDKMTYADLTDADKADLYEGGASLIRPLLNSKVDKEEGKGLSSNDYTDEEKTKLTELDRETNEIGQLQGRMLNAFVSPKFVNIFDASGWKIGLCRLNGVVSSSSTLFYSSKHIKVHGGDKLYLWVTLEG